MEAAVECQLDEARLEALQQKLNEVRLEPLQETLEQKLDEARLEALQQKLNKVRLEAFMQKLTTDEVQLTREEAKQFHEMVIDAIFSELGKREKPLNDEDTLSLARMMLRTSYTLLSKQLNGIGPDLAKSFQSCIDQAKRA